MATFQDRIVEYLGSADADTAAITDVLTAGAKKIVDLLPYEKLEKIAKAIDVPAAGVAISGYRLIREKNGFRAYDDSFRGCRTIPSNLAYNVTNANSLHYAPTADPICYILNQKFYVKPSDGSVDGVAYPTVLYSDSAITDFPSEWVQGVVLYGAIQRAFNKAATAIADLDAFNGNGNSTFDTDNLCIDIYRCYIRNLLKYNNRCITNTTGLHRAYDYVLNNDFEYLCEH